MNLRDGVLLWRNAISAEDLQFLADFVRQAEMTDSLVSNFEDEAPHDTVEWVVDKKIRDTQEVRLTDAVTDKINAIVGANVRTFVNAFYGVEVRDWEPAHILHYGVGGHYVPHVDAETLYKDDIDRDFWEKTLDRDLSVVYFLNDDFVGGDLKFPDLDLVIKPEAGTLVCFPSDHNYIHGVTAVTSGHRYVIVTWMRVNGVPTMDEINQMNMDAYERARPKRIEQSPRIVKR
jgi:predicted 2-oxoglutarate/Fe(II)-dependent dioxygenase YbiX